MAGRSKFQKERPPKDLKRGRLAKVWPLQDRRPDDVAREIRFGWDGAHKDYPAPNLEWIPSLRHGKTRCARFGPEDFPLILETLRRAIRAECVDEDFRNGFPARLWAFVNDQLHEARLSNDVAGEYHAFPLEREEQYPANYDILVRRAPRDRIPRD